MANDKDFKISNDYVALYTRLMAYYHPEFKDFFTFKKMKASGRVRPNQDRLNTL